MNISRIEREIHGARQKLLDLTFRNRLLNHRPTRARTLRIVDELPRETYDTLVLRGKPMHFLPKEPTEGRLPLEGDPEESSNVDATEPPEIWNLPHPDDQVAERHTDLALQTALEADALQKRLFRISAQSEAFVEEQGYTVLFLALGFGATTDCWADYACLWTIA